MPRVRYRLRTNSDPVLQVFRSFQTPPVTASSTDLEAYYCRQAPLFGGLVVVGTLEGTFLQPLISGEPIFHVANISGIPMVILCVVLAASKNRRVNSVLGPMIILMVLFDTILANPAISIG